MILITAVIGILSGLAGHRTDRIFEAMDNNGTPRTWVLSSRYGTGYLIAMFVFYVFMFRHPERDEIVGKSLLAGIFVGFGTVAGHLLDWLMEGRE